MIRYDQAYFRTVRHLPEGLRPALKATIESIARDHPNLPTEADERERLPPGAIRHRRAIPGTAWRVYFTWTAEDVVIRSVTIPQT